MGKVVGCRMWRWCSALRTFSFTAEGEGGGWVLVEEKMRRRVEDRRGMLKWWRGSMRIIAFEVVVERAVAMMRVTKEVFPEPEGWWAEGGETRERIGGCVEEGRRRESRGGMVK